MKYLATVVSLIFLSKTLFWNEITFPASNSLKLAELVINELTKSISKKFTNISFSIRFITAQCKEKDITLQNLHQYSLLSIMDYQSLNFEVEES